MPSSATEGRRIPRHARAQAGDPSSCEPPGAASACECTGHRYRVEVERVQRWRCVERGDCLEGRVRVGRTEQTRVLPGRPPPDGEGPFQGGPNRLPGRGRRHRHHRSSQLLRSPRERGLNGFRLIIADHHGGLVKAVCKVMLGAGPPEVPGPLPAVRRRPEGTLQGSRQAGAITQFTLPKPPPGAGPHSRRQRSAATEGASPGGRVSGGPGGVRGGGMPSARRSARAVRPRPRRPAGCRPSRQSKRGWRRCLLKAPRLIHPTTYVPALPVTRPRSCGTVPVASSNGSPAWGTPR